MEHIGPAHDESELEALKAVARQCLAASQRKLDLARALPDGPRAARCRSRPCGWLTCRALVVVTCLKAHGLTGDSRPCPPGPAAGRPDKPRTGRRRGQGGWPFGSE